MSRSPVAFGRFIITRRIARGGMAEIYRARTRSNDDGGGSRWVALKMMRPSLGHEALREELFKREARICSAINHPNIVPVYEFGREQDRHFISMEFVRGRDLSHLIRRTDEESEPVSFGVGMYIAVQAACGLGHAHRLTGEDGADLQIVHRDVSPGNVMVGYDGAVKVLDFGVARINETHGLRTQTGTLRGKFAYMAPEQTLGLRVDSRTDVFSFGTLLYELLTGSNPFRAGAPVTTLERVQRVRPLPPSKANRQIPKAVDSILARCLAKDPRRRFADGRELHEALAEFLDKRNIDERERCVRYMNQRFAWEKAQEEKELVAEEDEVALIEVVDFDLKDDGELDAPYLIVSDEQEASQADVVRAAAGADNAEDVFDADDATVAIPAPPGLLDEFQATEHGTGLGGEKMRAALAKLRAGAVDEADAVLDEDSGETIAQPNAVMKAWVQPGGSREVEASSLLSHEALEPAAETTSAGAAAVSDSRWRARLAAVVIAGAAVGALVVAAFFGRPRAPEPPVPSPAMNRPTKIEPVTIQVAPPPPAPVTAPPASIETPVAALPAKKSGIVRRQPVAKRSAKAAKKKRTRRGRTPRKKAAKKTAVAKKTPEKAAAKKGYLNVGARPWAEIIIDGKKWPYQTPQAGIELSAGKHVITLRNPDTQVTKSATVLIKPGAYRTLKMDLSKP